MTLEGALDRLRTYRILAATEADFQRQLATVFELEDIVFEREYVLDVNNRIDFYLPQWRAGLETKIDGSPGEVIRQLHRYKQFELASLVLVTTRARHGSLPACIGSTPLHTVVLWRGAF